MFSGIAMVGNDLRFHTATASPTILIDRMTAAGSEPHGRVAGTQYCAPSGTRASAPSSGRSTPRTRGK